MYYERKINEFKYIKIDNSKIIVNEKLAQAYLSIGKKKPSIARNRPSYIWNDENYYKQIFQDSNISKLLFCYKIYEYCNSIKKSKMKIYSVDEKLYTLVSYGALHLSRVIATLLLNTENLPDENILDEHIRNIESNPSMLQTHYDNAVKILGDILEENRGRYSSIITFLKTNEIQKLINKKIKKILNSNSQNH